MDVRVQTPDILPPGNFLHRSGLQATRDDIFDIPPSTQLPVEPIISHMCKMDLRYGDDEMFGSACALKQKGGAPHGSRLWADRHFSVGWQLRCLYIFPEMMAVVGLSLRRV
jgi:hypothetical protein